MTYTVANIVLACAGAYTLLMVWWLYRRSGKQRSEVLWVAAALGTILLGTSIIAMLRGVF